MRCFPFWHDWGRWSDPAESICADVTGTGYFAVAQIRTCNACGVAQVRRLPRLRSVKGILADVERGAAVDRARRAGQ